LGSNKTPIGKTLDQARPNAARRGALVITNKLMIKIENLTKSTGRKLLAWSGFWFIPRLLKGRVGMNPQNTVASLFQRSRINLESII
jgi:hypothetical protein